MGEEVWLDDCKGVDREGDGDGDTEEGDGEEGEDGEWEELDSSMLEDVIIILEGFGCCMREGVA